MAAEIVSTQILPARFQEKIVLMDDYGTEHHLYVNLVGGSERASLIASLQASMDAKVQAMEAYATANGHDLSAQKTAGQAKKAARKKASGITTPSEAPAAHA